MVGKLTAVLIRKQAEAYRSQGLHEEAFALYDELLSSTPNIDEPLKSDIQSQMDDIAEEMEAFSDHKDKQSLSSKEMMLLKDGWENCTSSADILISARGLCQIGAHQDALIEFGKLLKAGIAPNNVIDSTTKCFTNLYSHKELPIAAEKWLRDIYPEDKKVIAVHLLFIKELSQHSDKGYAFQYCSYIKSKPSLPDKLRQRLDAAGAKYKAAIQEEETHPKSKPDLKSLPKTAHIPDNGTKMSSGEQQTTDTKNPEVRPAPGNNDESTETDSEILEKLLAEQPKKMFGDKPKESDAKPKKFQLKFMKIKPFELFGRVFESLFHKKNSSPRS
jgi:tetratricopeptide (TPR) repeat protein